MEKSEINELQLTEKALQEYNQRQQQIQFMSGKSGDAFGPIASSFSHQIQSMQIDASE